MRRRAAIWIMVKAAIRVAKFYPSITVGLRSTAASSRRSVLGYLCADAGIVTKCGARPSRQSPAPRQLSHRVGIGAPSSLGASKSSSPGSGGVTAVVAIGGKRGPWRGAHALGAAWGSRGPEGAGGRGCCRGRRGGLRAEHMHPDVGVRLSRAFAAELRFLLNAGKRGQGEKV